MESPFLNLRKRYRVLSILELIYGPIIEWNQTLLSRKTRKFINVYILLNLGFLEINKPW